jgi:hypothetical protein
VFRRLANGGSFFGDLQSGAVVGAWSGGICLEVEQGLDRRELTAPGPDMQGSLMAIIYRIHRDTGFNQDFLYLRKITIVQGGVALQIAGLNIYAGFGKELGHRSGLAAMQERIPMFVRGIEVYVAIGNQGKHPMPVGAHADFMKLLLGGGGGLK